MDLNVLLVDDHPMLRHGLSQAMARQPRLRLVGETSSGVAAVKLAEELTPDLIVMDVHLPDLNGIAVTRQILDKQPAIKIIVFSSDADRSLVDQALEAGASGYVLKQGSLEELIQAIEMVMAGRLYLSPEVNTAILAHYRKGLVDGPEPSTPVLSEREKQLLRLIAEGRRNKEIAAQLKLSPKSIETYRARLMKKLGCSSTAEVVRYAIREGVILP
jgi:two-component system, NarL family, response regulator NreC